MLILVRKKKKIKHKLMEMWQKQQEEERKRRGYYGIQWEDWQRQEGGGGYQDMGGWNCCGQK